MKARTTRTRFGVVMALALSPFSLLPLACGSSASNQGANDGGSDGNVTGGDSSAAGGDGNASVIDAGASSRDGGDGGIISDGAACPPGDALPACFTHGRWKIDNQTPCFVTGANEGGTQGAVSTSLSGNMVVCPTDLTTKPSIPWSTDTLTTDCAGHFRLCYTLKGGSGTNPQPSDCVMAQSCAEADYTTVRQPQTWPDLPSWITTGPVQVACAQAFEGMGGYGEMTVTGTPTSGCAPFTKTFAHVTYCPLACTTNPDASPMCAGCQSGGTGGAF